MKEYPVNTLIEMAAIPDEATPRFIEEFPALLAAIKAGLEMQSMGIGVRNFVWRDDGERAVTAHMKVDGEDILSLKVKL